MAGIGVSVGLGVAVAADVAGCVGPCVGVAVLVLVCVLVAVEVLVRVGEIVIVGRRVVALITFRVDVVVAVNGISVSVADGFRAGVEVLLGATVCVGVSVAAIVCPRILDRSNFHTLLSVPAYNIRPFVSRAIVLTE